MIHLRHLLICTWNQASILQNWLSDYIIANGLKDAFPNPEERLKHILENQVYGFAPSEIIYNISTNFIFGNLSQDISRKNFVLEDTIPAAKEGRIQELVDSYFENN